MLIVEGTDLVGKTTLCWRLVEELNKRTEHGGYDYGHLTRLPRGWNHYWSYATRMTRRRVQDRFHDSDIAYRRAQAQQSAMEDVFQYRLVQAKLDQLGAYKVVIYASDTLLVDRHKQRGDQMYDIDVVLKVNKEFMKMHHLFDHSVSCNIHEPWPSGKAIAEILQLYLQRQAQLSVILHNGGRTDDRGL